MLKFLRNLFCKKENKQTENKLPEVKNLDSPNENKRLKALEKQNALLDGEIKRIMEEMTQKDKVIESKNEKLGFIAQVINSLPVINSSYEKYKKLLKEDYMKYANENDSLAGEAAALLKLQSVSDQLQLITYDEALINKNIVAIAGSFSSGKSSFMNSFFTTRKIKLPTGMDQTTAIASYVLNGQESITGYSYRGGRVDISDSVFKLFSYGKIEEFNFNMKQIINHIVFRNSFAKPFDNLCFIDTPGFNPGQETETDFDTATNAIATANSVLWCVDISAGTIKSDEFDILYEIFSKNENIGIYIILNKADLKSDEENMLVMDEIENQLNMKSIPFDGITLYTSNRTFTEQPEEYSNCHKGMSLLEFLEQNNTENSQKEKNLLHIVDEVFEEYINADKNRIDRLQKQIRTLKVLEGSFSEISDSKDEIIAYYKARVDTKRYKIKSVEESSDKDEDLFDGISDLKLELKSTVDMDIADIDKAKSLCKNMKLAVAEVFGHYLVADENSAEASSSVKKFCTGCGKELNLNSKFCPQCGKECF